jgi:hypothetical protein
VLGGVALAAALAFGFGAQNVAATSSRGPTTGGAGMR